MYISPTGNTILESADYFLYEVEVFLVYPDRMETYSSQIIRKKNPLPKKYMKKTVRKKDCTVFITADWVGAPMSFLEKHGFVPLSNEEYKTSIKLNRTIKK